MSIPIETAINELLDSNKHVLSTQTAETLKFLFETKEGKNVLDKWLQEKIDSKDELSDISIANVDFDDLYSKIYVRIDISKERSPFIKFINKFRKIAAILFIPIAIAFAIVIYEYSAKLSNLENDIASIINFDEKSLLPINLQYLSPAGARLRFTLSDCTTICLNGNSKLTISPDFCKTDRKVKLEGEAYFEVAKNPEKKFIVNAGDVNVIALGTSFYVQAYPSEKNVEAVLISGKVAIEELGKKKDGNMILLTPNQKYVYEKEKGNVTLASNIKTKKYKVWTDGELIFEDESFLQMISRLEHFYNVKFNVVDKEIYAYSFTASLDNCSLEQIMEYIKLSSPIEYKINENEITLNIIQ